MSPVTLMTHPHLLSLLLSLNKGLSSYLPMALGNFAHNYEQSCSSLWVNLPIVVGKLYSCTSSFIIIVIFLARTLLYIELESYLCSGPCCFRRRKAIRLL